MSEKTKNEVLTEAEIQAEADLVRENKNVKIIALVGMSGSGKSVAVDYLTEKATMICSSKKVRTMQG